MVQAFCVQRGSFRPEILVTATDNLPQQLTSFVGREREIAEIIELLSRNRLVTILGTGGSGKTRLSLQVATTLREKYPDGVWFVQLDTIYEPQLVLQAVAAALGVREDGRTGRALLDTLVERLRKARTLIVLDNCEHLVEACARVASSLLMACSHLRLLATSRQALGVEGEAAWPMPTLTIPDSVAQPLESLARYEAVQLFVERAANSRPGFTITAENARAVVELCTQLDGLPLAIELAAARVKVLAVEQIVARLGERFRLLISGSQTALPRQQTLRALMDWSYELLSNEESMLLRSLSAFSGSFGLEAVTAVCGGETDEFEIIDLLAHLNDKSLVIMEERHGEARYRLLETIRQYAFEKLEEAKEMAPVRHRHLEWYLGIARKAQNELLGANQAQWLNRLEMEHENLRAALDWAIHGEKSANDALQLSSMVWRFWDMRGYISEGRRWLEEALAMEEDTEPLIRARALTAAGNLAVDLGDMEYANAVHSEALRLRRETGDMRATAGSLSNLGVIARAQGDYKRAEELYEESLSIFWELGSDGSAAAVLDNLGFLALTQGKYERAEELHTQAMNLSRKVGDTQGVVIAFNNLGEVAQARGEYEQAEEFYKQALELNEEIADKVGAVGIMNNLASIKHLKGDQAQAGELYRESLEISRELEYLPGIAEILEGLAVVEAEVSYERAARLLGAAMALRDRIGAPVTPNERSEYEKQMGRIRAGSGPRFDRLLASGKALTLEQAIVLAREMPSEEPQPVAVPEEPDAPDPAGSIKSADLTKREVEVLRLLVRGCSAAEVATELALSPRTVHAHLHSIYEKLGVNGRGGATHWATEHGII